MTKLYFRVIPKSKENTTNVVPMTALSVDIIPGGQITKIKLPEDDGSHCCCYARVATLPLSLAQSDGAAVSREASPSLCINVD